jgi:hypothetical protein
MPRADKITPGKETPLLENPQVQNILQNTYKTGVNIAAGTTNLSSGGEAAKILSDDKTTASQLGYQWVKGTGIPTHTFTEKSVMGKQMLATPEIQNAIKEAITKVSKGDTTLTRFARSAGKEPKMDYIKSFAKDLKENSARAFHGSFAGNITVKDSVLPDGINKNISMKIKLHDDMTAISATHIPGNYDKSAIGYKNNPYGPQGQLRSISIDYKMKLDTIVPINIKPVLKLKP